MEGDEKVFAFQEEARSSIDDSTTSIDGIHLHPLHSKEDGGQSVEDTVTSLFSTFEWSQFRAILWFFRLFRTWAFQILLNLSCLVGVVLVFTLAGIVGADQLVGGTVFFLLLLFLPLSFVVFGRICVTIGHSVVAENGSYKDGGMRAHMASSKITLRVLNLFAVSSVPCGWSLAVYMVIESLNTASSSVGFLWLQDGIVYSLAFVVGLTFPVLPVVVLFYGIECHRICKAIAYVEQQLVPRVTELSALHRVLSAVRAAMRSHSRRVRIFFVYCLLVNSLLLLVFVYMLLFPNDLPSRSREGGFWSQVAVFISLVLVLLFFPARVNFMLRNLSRLVSKPEAISIGWEDQVQCSLWLVADPLLFSIHGLAPTFPLLFRVLTTCISAISLAFLRQFLGFTPAPPSCDCLNVTISATVTL